jgi:hypothetical protein
MADAIKASTELVEKDKQHLSNALPDLVCTTQKTDAAI